MNDNNSNPYQVQVRLYKNPLDKEKDNYYARVKAHDTVDIADICKQAELRGGSDISATLMQHAVEAFFKEMSYKLQSGMSVNTGYFVACPSVKGVFKSPHDKFDKERHSLQFKFYQGHMLRKDIENINVNIANFNTNAPTIANVYDHTTNEDNNIITPSHIIKLTGKRIRIAGDDDSIGLYFINTQTGERTKVNSNSIIENKPKSVYLICPHLTPGTYTIEIRTQHINSNVTSKQVNTITYDGLLQVI